MTHLSHIQTKILDPKTLDMRLRMWRFKGEKIVFTNGCFDLIHQGHIDYLSKAADMGTHLIVGVNADESVKRLGKGSSRPLQDENSRALIIAALHFITAVVIFTEDTPLQLIQLVQPDVLVKGADWKPESIVGFDIVKAKGGEIKTIDYLAGFSTTAIEERIRKG